MQVRGHLDRRYQHLLAGIISRIGAFYLDGNSWAVVFLGEVILRHSIMPQSSLLKQSSSGDCTTVSTYDHFERGHWNVTANPYQPRCLFLSGTRRLIFTCPGVRFSLSLLLPNICKVCNIINDFPTLYRLVTQVFRGDNMEANLVEYLLRLAYSPYLSFILVLCFIIVMTAPLRRSSFSNGILIREHRHISMYYLNTVLPRYRSFDKI